MIKVLFFAKLSEQLGVRELQVEEKVQDTDHLIQYLADYQSGWASILQAQSWLKAVNQTIVNNNTALSDGDEVAFFPPVTGG